LDISPTTWPVCSRGASTPGPCCFSGSDKARPTLARIFDLSSDVRREAFADLSEEEGRHLVDLLRRVHGNLADGGPSPASTAPPKIEPARGRPIRRPVVVAGDLAPVGSRQ
jgi:hypothetical protein